MATGMVLVGSPQNHFFLYNSTLILCFSQSFRGNVSAWTVPKGNCKLWERHYCSAPTYSRKLYRTTLSKIDHDSPKKFEYIIFNIVVFFRRWKSRNHGLLLLSTTAKLSISSFCFKHGSSYVWEKILGSYYYYYYYFCLQIYI